MLKSRLIGLLALGCALVAQVAGASSWTDAGGGSAAAPLVVGNHLYVGTGATLQTWDVTDPAHPAYVGRTGAEPAPGTISSVVPVGNYLYAAWSNPDGGAGITIYARTDPAHPVQAGNYDAYVDSEFRGPVALAVSGSRAFLVDGQNGLFVLDVTNPLAPTVVSHVNGVNVADSATLIGNTLFATGNNFLGDRIIVAADVTDPAHPTVLGNAVLDWTQILRIFPTTNEAFGVGVRLQVYDTTNPANMTQIADVAIDEATSAWRQGNTLYLFGPTGVQVWDVTTPATPQLLRTVAMPTFAPDRVGTTPTGPVVITRTDRAVLINSADLQHPTLATQFTLPLGVSARAAVFDAAHVYFGQEAYGFSVADPQTLAPIGRFDADLPEQLAARDIEDIALEGLYAYLAVWGFGVIVADVATPTAPVEVGQLEFPFASAIEVHGNRVYASSTTNGGVFKIIDVSNPAAPAELGSLGTSKTYDLNVRGNYAFLADGSEFGDGGLRVVDVSTPNTPLLVGQNGNCTYALGLYTSADGNRTYLACASDANGAGALTIVDTTDKAHPALTSSLVLPGSEALPDYNVGYAIEVVGTTAYVGTEYGVDVIDVSAPAHPVWQSRNVTASAVRRLSLAPDGRLFAFAGQGGVYVMSTATEALFRDGFEQP